MTRIAAFTALLAATSLLPIGAHAEMTAEQKKEVEALVRQYILDNGDVLIESVNNYQTRQEADANKASEEKAKEFMAGLSSEKELAVAGNPQGDVTIVEFFDYNCGYCRKAFEEIQSIIRDDKQVKVVLYDMPILGPSSHEISKWALAAKRQNKYFEYHSALMSHTGEKDEATFKRLAKDAGLDADKLAKDAKDPAIEDEIKKHLATAQELGFMGTPAFIVGEKVFKGYIPYDVLKATVKEERSK